MEQPSHVPVLVEEVLAALAPRPGGFYVDCTVGAGGHAAALLERAPGSRLLAIDKDRHALALAAARLAPYGDRVELVEADFKDIAALAAARGIARVDGILADLGVSSIQLDTPERGFSFRFDAPLDMRMGSRGPTAADVVNTYSERELERVLRDYGEEPRARALARRIVMQRAEAPITTTGHLRALVHDVKRGKRGRGPGERIDPATRAFQALRIEVNGELAGLAEFLGDSIALLEGGGRIAILTFHSLEDRIVKWELKRMEGGCTCPPSLPTCVCSRTRIISILTRRPTIAGEAELARNPRARSAKLRAAEKVL